MRWLLLGVVLLAGCGPSALEKAKARYELHKETFDEAETMVKKYQLEASRLTPEYRGEIEKTIEEMKQLRDVAKDRMEESRSEVTKLSQ